MNLDKIIERVATFQVSDKPFEYPDFIGEVERGDRVLTDSDKEERCASVDEELMRLDTFADDRRLVLVVTQEGNSFKGTAHYQDDIRKRTDKVNLYGSLSSLAREIDDWAEKETSSMSVGYPYKAWSNLKHNVEGTVEQVLRQIETHETRTASDLGSIESRLKENAKLLKEVIDNLRQARSPVYAYAESEGGDWIKASEAIDKAGEAVAKASSWNDEALWHAEKTSK